MTTFQIILTGFIIFVIVMLSFAIYEMKNAEDVDPNDETFFRLKTEHRYDQLSCKPRAKEHTIMPRCSR